MFWLCWSPLWCAGFLLRCLGLCGHGHRGLSCAMVGWILISRPGIEPIAPAFGRCTLCHWTTREVLTFCSSVQFRSLQFSRSVVSDSLRPPWTAACQASLSITNPWSLLKLMSVESVMPSNRLSLCHPLLLLPSVFPSIGVFSKESVLCIRWPKFWSLRFNISPSNEYSGLISFRISVLRQLKALM